MKNSRWARGQRPARMAMRSAVVTAVGLAAATSLPAGLASAQTSASGPMVKLIVAQKSINVPRFGKRVFIDPGVYVTAVGTPLQFDVQRASYAQPITNTQIIHLPGGGTVSRPLPDWTVKSWAGLHRFIRVTVRNSAGKIVASHVGPFCPDDFSAQRSNPNAPARSRFPQQCQSDPFQLANAWGIQRGWGVDTGFMVGQGPAREVQGHGQHHPAVAAVPAPDAAHVERDAHHQGGQAELVRPVPAVRPASREAPPRPERRPPPAACQRADPDQPAGLVASRPLAAALLGHQDPALPRQEPVGPGDVRRHGLERRPVEAGCRGFQVARLPDHEGLPVLLEERPDHRQEQSRDDGL